jgi:hypothetical protein
MLKFARQTAIASLLVVASVSSAFAAEKDIVDTAVAAGSFNTLVTAVSVGRVFGSKSELN